MSEHTTFRIGGPADAFALPRTEQALAALLSAARGAGLPCILLGGGANLLVGDKGIRGLVITTVGLTDTSVSRPRVRAGAGLAVAKLVETARDAGLTGLEFAAGLPGSVGGAVYMNARCYGREFADILTRVRFLDREGNTIDLGPDRREWSYKKTPFMPGQRLEGAVILGAEFRLESGDRKSISARMGEFVSDRASKGHFDFPCAGSVFKNDRRFGKPTGLILDELGFRGRALGSAAVSEKHANIFVNPGAATAADMRALIELAQREAKDRFGYDLEPEVVMVGEFS